MNQTGKITATVLNFRPEPSTRRRPIGQLKRGDIVKIISREGRWYKIQSGDKTGFIWGNFLTILDDQPFHQFLFEQEALRTHPLEPTEAIEIDPDFSRDEKQIAHTWNRFGGLIDKLSGEVDIDPGAALAVLVVESSGNGFSSDGHMIIRFENHKFLKYYGKKHPDIFKSHFKYDQNKRWQGHQFRKSPTGHWKSFHGKQSREWEVFNFARELNPPAAMLSISMGLPQIMGFNYAAIGYDSVGEMFDSLSNDVRFHILGLFDFIRGSGNISPMLQALQNGNFEQFASRYNGPGQAAKYGDWIDAKFETFNQIT